ncbi:MAG: aspartate-semialdehyde dehydrogenase [Holosporaceae bacterium]|jgi:aspartate-semialdehyde dehydrogenase|nr:aspartate-semialdehyde dehydrogenase [Holosporaceae bacterium]
MKYAKEYNVAVVGATGNAGMKTLQILAERNFPIANIVAIASEKSVGKEVSYKNKSLRVQRFSDVDFSTMHLAFFCAGGAFSRKYADTVTEKGCVIIDKSSHFRLNPKVPLVVPEINAKVLRKGAPLGIISTPNCVAVPLSMTLKALAEIAPLKRAVVSTYQSVSGAGKKAVDELYDQSRSIISAAAPNIHVFSKQIAYNVIPAVGDILSAGISEEEEKISFEVCKILKSDIRVAVTCVRVPVFIGHCMSVACEFSKPITEENVYDVFENFDGILTIDRREESGAFATPVDVQNEDAVFVSRIRKDLTVKNGLMYWIASDNVRKGAALNSVQIAEEMIREDPTLSTFKRQKQNNGSQ